MKMIKLTALTGAFAVALLFTAPMGMAQDEVPPPPPPGGPEQATPVQAPGATVAATPGAPKGGDRMEQFRQRMNDFLKTSLKVSDEEWGVILPLLEKVQIKQRDALVGRFGMFGGRRGGGGGGGDRGGRPERPASPEADTLKAALESEATSPADVKAKLEALREARKKAAADLEQAREDLRKVLTQRQEATLVLAGILE